MCNLVLFLFFSGLGCACVAAANCAYTRGNETCDFSCFYFQSVNGRCVTLMFVTSLRKTRRPFRR